jgi:hypothetical protein
VTVVGLTAAAGLAGLAALVEWEKRGQRGEEC